jgi:hypothetical protein
MFITIYINTSRRDDTAATNENAGEFNHCLQQFMLLIALVFKTIYNCYTHVNSIYYVYSTTECELMSLLTTLM